MSKRVPNICSPIKRGWAAVFKISRLYICSIWIYCDSLKHDILDTRITDEMLNVSAKNKKETFAVFFHILGHPENIFSNLSHKGIKFIQHILLCHVSLTAFIGFQTLNQCFTLLIIYKCDSSLKMLWWLYHLWTISG